ncbi:hypothetical protein RFI_15913 [Reticulomyxa filosa]|uniref:RRM domain-containing protein n=1 Tax=Reticulomyxa filosa TaxID=46433 RepID=X6N5K2_RETFI|nr:hypothetical protein RFI_15913 [Reticulomyxa filosa]|eukprot:ETO21291.1 hypothetical protein RFI_15913 [Reticulomyxa filosa]
MQPMLIQPVLVPTMDNNSALDHNGQVPMYNVSNPYSIGKARNSGNSNVNVASLQMKVPPPGPAHLQSVSPSPLTMFSPTTPGHLNTPVEATKMNSMIPTPTNNANSDYWTNSMTGFHPLNYPRNDVAPSSTLNKYNPNSVHSHAYSYNNGHSHGHSHIHNHNHNNNNNHNHSHSHNHNYNHYYYNNNNNNNNNNSNNNNYAHNHIHGHSHTHNGHNTHTNISTNNINGNANNNNNSSNSNNNNTTGITSTRIMQATVTIAITVSIYNNNNNNTNNHSNHSIHSNHNNHSNIINNDNSTSNNNGNVSNNNTNTTSISTTTTATGATTNSNKYNKFAEGAEESSRPKDNTPKDRPLQERKYSYPIPDHPPFCVWLGNMPSSATEKHVADYFEQMGVTIKDVRWGRRQGAHTCCYIDFHNVEHMKIALQTIGSNHAPRFMRRSLKIDINEGIRVDRESAVTAVTKRPVKNKPRRNPHNAPTNHEIFVTTAHSSSHFKSRNQFSSSPTKT